MPKSFMYALEGIGIAFRDHPHFRFHTATAIVIVIASILLRISRLEFLIVLFTINLVLIVEMLNTSIEEITDLITIKWARQAKIAKDVAAGMALVTSICAVLVGVIIFLPYLLKLFS